MNELTDGPGRGLEDRLEELMATAAPPTGAVTDDRVTELSRILARQIVEADRSVRGRSRALSQRRKGAAIAAMSAMVLVPTGAWAAEQFLAQTGRFGAPHPGTQDDSEFINLCARDFAKYVATLAPTGLPAPPDHSWSEITERVAASEGKNADCGATTEAAEQETDLRLSVVVMATEGWGCSLVWANRDGDASGEQEARRAMNRLNAEATRLSPDSGFATPPDTYLANSRRSDFTGCAR